MLAVLAPWAVLRLLPLSELASAAAGSLRHEARMSSRGSSSDPGPSPSAVADAITGSDWARALTARMGSDADALDSSEPATGPPGAPSSSARGAGSASVPAATGHTDGARPAGEEDTHVAAAVGPPNLSGGGTGAAGSNGPGGTRGSSPSAAPSGSGSGQDDSAGSGPDAGAGTGRDRLPGLGPAFQSEDFTDVPVPFYPEGWDPADPPTSQGNGEPPAGEDHDPLPEPQPDPEDGP
jgi:hypothetical protein